jgi:hypothetical protein
LFTIKITYQDVLAIDLKVGHGIHGDGTDDGHDTCNGIAELGGDGDVLGNLLRSLADGVLTSLVACAAVGQGGGNIECETHGNEGAEAHGTAVLYKVASTLAAIL